MIKMDCRRCSGRKRLLDTGKKCYVCLGNGDIVLTRDQIDQYFSRYRPVFRPVKKRER